MKAAYLTGFGGPEVLEVGKLAMPEPGPGQLLVRVSAAGLNYYDTLVRAGAVSQDIPLPHIPGSDVIGHVEAVGEGVERFQEGDRIIVAPGFPVDAADWDTGRENYTPSFYPGGTFNHGGYGQYMVIHERWALPNDLDIADEELASMPLVVVTAMHTVKTLGQVRSGMRVLVQAGASGSGSMAIQVAKALGARVITTVSTEIKAERARAVGADEVIFYRKENFADVAREWSGGDGVDVVIDNLGGSALADNLRAVKWGGKVVNFGLVAGNEAKIPNVYHFFRGQYQLLGSFMGTMDELREGLALIKAGKLRPVVDEVMPLERVREAHERLDAHHVNGNLVLLPWGTEH
ncbi:MAG TPA: zinc-binding dehydrogenase [Gammaproteobacteria bacterium]|nr:zinc-binding dehydrogenase [Gammaproteobacteria bacterium]